jgi:nuclear pore complex protein Nup98-Nup96
MARFSANKTDSSEDEDELYLNQSQELQKKPKGSQPPPVEDEEDSDEEAASSSSSSDMQEDELVTSPRRKGPGKTRNALIENDDGEIRYAHEITKGQPPYKKSPPRQQRGDPTIIPWAQQLGVDAQKMHVMQTSLFRMPEEAAAMKAMKNPTSVKRLLLPPQPMNRKHSRDSDGDGLRMESREVRDSLRTSIYMSDNVFREPRLRTTLNLCLIAHHGNMHEWKVGRLL